MESMISTNYMSKMGNCSSDDDDSSWDFYLEDFKHSYHYQSASETSSSMASLLNHDHSSAKRRKTQSRPAFVDHDLEDTATSPDHTTTTTTNLNAFTIFQKHKASLFQELHKQQQRAASSKGIKRSDEVEDGDELRKKGLCLVPLSIFVDYYVS